ncbi:MAG: cobaltochelatase subunit CobN [Desulfurispora sp.]|uniref:cobaltochelatase subunit CobN n=1 Tax=Desulfurispora sp. TaxID=3014275 RepID=UPI00404A8DD9
MSALSKDRPFNKPLLPTNPRPRLIVRLLTIYLLLGILLVTGPSALPAEEQSSAPGQSTSLVIITGTNSLVSPLVQAYHNLTDQAAAPYPLRLRVFSPNDLESSSGRQAIKETFLQADIILLEMLGTNREAPLRELFQQCWQEKWQNSPPPTILLQRSGEKNSDGTWNTGGLLTGLVQGLPLQINQDNTVWQNLNTYIVQSGISNWEKLLLYLGSTFGHITTSADLTPIKLDKSFLYHPAADASSPYYEAPGTVQEGVYESVYNSVYNSNGLFFDLPAYFQWYTCREGYRTDAPWIGILSYDTYFKNNDQQILVESLRALEEKGLNVLLLYAPSDKRHTAVRQFFFWDKLGNGEIQAGIDVFICQLGFQFDRSKNGDTKTLQLFQEMDLPVLTPIYTSDLEKWQNDPAGAIREVYWQIALPELEGRIEPVLLGGTVTLQTDPATGATITRKVALPDRVQRLAERAAAWAKLRNLPNEQKKVAILYYNLHGGKDGITASYLNVPRSLTAILQAMSEAGYRVDPQLELRAPDGSMDPDKVFAAMFERGRNVGGWAPGELKQLASRSDVLKINLDSYLKWYNRLPAELRTRVEKAWGPPPGQMMVYENQVVLPGVLSGNIFFGPQPMRGWGENVDNITHSPDLPPPHQYLAFYFWLQEEFGAHAVVHLGTHGTAEWLPGKAVGLSSTDWPDIVHGSLPNIYPYIINNPGEGTQAKRRGYAVLISHLIPAVSSTRLYGQLMELHDLAHQYSTAAAAAEPDIRELERLKQKINYLLEDDGLAIQLGLDLKNLTFEQALETAHHHLDQLQSEVTPLGLHTFGQPPTGERLEQTVQAMVYIDPANRMDKADQYQQLLIDCQQEMSMLLKALAGGYVPPGPSGDPLRNPDILPTGRNTSSFDPRTAPDRLAWETGKKCADDLLAAYYQKHGHYPDTVGVVLWATETMRTHGESIALALRLLGTEPVWDSKGYLSTVKITPLEQLGRPRVDVVLTISGLFRDTFSVAADLLDKAVRLVASLDESPENNHLRKNSLALRQQLISSGLSESEADFLAQSRVFGPAPGTYGNGMAEMMSATSAWQSEAQLADVYLSRQSYIYAAAQDNNSPTYGQSARQVLEGVLKNLQAAVQVRDALYGTLDNDDVAQYLGGLVLAGRVLSGKDVDAFIANTRGGLANARVQTLEQFVSLELQSRLLNPDFIQAMLQEGYAGSTTIAKWLGNTFFMDATAQAIADWGWRGLAEKYIFDQQVRDQLDPFALQSAIAFIAEAARRNMWQARPDELQKLSDAYIQAAVNYGVACCHHTCHNLVFNQWLADFSTLDEDAKRDFARILARATGQETNNLQPPEQPNQDEPAVPEQPNQSEPPNNTNDDRSNETTAPAVASTPVANVEKSPLDSSGASGGETLAHPPAAPAAGPQPGPAPAASTTSGAQAEQAQPQPQQQSKLARETTAGDRSAGAEKSDAPRTKAYEVIPQSAKSISPRAVTFWAILAAGALAGIMLTGYLRKK